MRTHGVICSGRPGNPHWRCDQYKATKCPGTAVTDQENRVNVTKAHSHAPDPARIQNLLQEHNAKEEQQGKMLTRSGKLLGTEEEVESSSRSPSRRQQPQHQQRKQTPPQNAPITGRRTRQTSNSSAGGSPPKKVPTAAKTTDDKSKHETHQGTTTAMTTKQQNDPVVQPQQPQPNQQEIAQESTKAGPNVQSHAILFGQAIRAGDLEQLGSLVGKLNGPSMNATVKELPSSDVLPFLQLVDRHLRQNGNQSIRNLQNWLKWVNKVLQLHSDHLATVPDLASHFGALVDWMERRTRHMDKLLQLQGKLRFVLEAMPSANRWTATGQQPLAVFDADDGKIVPPSSSKNSNKRSQKPQYEEEMDDDELQLQLEEEADEDNE